MSRRHSTTKREVLPDPVFEKIVVTKFINILMRKGKKSIAEKIFYKAMDILKDKVEDGKTVDIFKVALNNVKPQIEVKSRRVGGSTYQVPVEVRETRKESLAIRWLINAASSRGGKSMIENLSGEVWDAYNSRGAAVKKKEDTHKMADANKAFAHYVW